MAKVRIVLDADVLLHFAKAQRLSMLPEILPEYDHIVLDVVYGEVKSIQRQLGNQIDLIKNISMEQFNPRNDMMVEYVHRSGAHSHGHDLAVGKGSVRSCGHNRFAGFIRYHAVSVEVATNSDECDCWGGVGSLWLCIPIHFPQPDL